MGSRKNGPEQRTTEGLLQEERELLLRCKEGDASATEEMLNRYKNMVRSKAMTLFLVGGDKDDLIQEGMIGLFKALREYEEDKNDSFYAFAELCVMRQMYTAIKSSKRKKNIPLNNYISIDSMEEPEEAITAAKPYETTRYSLRNPEDFVIDRERSIRIESELYESLSEMEQRVLKLYSEGMSYTRIAQLLDKEPKSIDNAIQRIRGKLKTVLAGNTGL